MDDIENPEIVNIKLVNKIKVKSQFFIFMANGLSPPKINYDKFTILIGYKGRKKINNTSNIYWSLDYAPVKFKATNVRSKNNILIALGGAKGSGASNKILKALSLVKNIKTIDFLESPVNPVKINSQLLRPDQIIKKHRNLPEIQTILSKAGMVIASYGHLAYEAIALGTPLCLFNQKVFQNEYSKNLEKEALCYSGGLLSTISYEEIAFTIKKTLKNAEALTKNSKKKIDGMGLERIANIIYNIKKNNL